MDLILGAKRSECLFIGLKLDGHFSLVLVLRDSGVWNWRSSHREPLLLNSGNIINRQLGISG